MPTLTKLEQTWRMVETLSAKDRDILIARMNALKSLAEAEAADAGVLPNKVTMKEIRAELQAVREKRRHEKTGNRRP